MNVIKQFFVTMLVISALIAPFVVLGFAIPEDAASWIWWLEIPAVAAFITVCGWLSES